MRFHSLGWYLSLALSACAANGLATDPAPMQAEPVQNTTWLSRVSQPIRSTELHLESAASCAATACHGGPRPSVSNEYAARGSEYPIWLKSDPHARSWATFSSDASVAMMKRLNIFDGETILDRAAYDNCLACHNTTKQFNKTRSAEFHAEGVGCASCHGPSQNWRGDHYRFSFDPEFGSQIGWVANRDLLTRARMCASCHVGDSDRDMNHDIVAAGHPALHYEFATFHNMLPKHWREENDTRSPEFESKLWLAGQIAGLDASLALLEARASGQLSVSTWPEFASSDCSSCHQNLRIDNPDYSIADIRSNAARFSSWNSLGVMQIVSSPDSQAWNADGTELSSTLNALRELMSSHPIPDRSMTIDVARQSRSALDRWLTNQGRETLRSWNPEKLQRLATDAIRNQDTLSSWESASQAYLAIIAARRNWRRAAQIGFESERLAAEFRKMLLFQPGSKSLSILDVPERDLSIVASRLALLLGKTSAGNETTTESPRSTQEIHDQGVIQHP